MVFNHRSIKYDLLNICLREMMDVYYDSWGQSSVIRMAVVLKQHDQQQGCQTTCLVYGA